MRHKLQTLAVLQLPQRWACLHTSSAHVPVCGSVCTWGVEWTWAHPSHYVQTAGNTPIKHISNVNLHVIRYIFSIINSNNFYCCIKKTHYYQCLSHFQIFPFFLHLYQLGLKVYLMYFRYSLNWFHSQVRFQINFLNVQNNLRGYATQNPMYSSLMAS